MSVFSSTCKNGVKIVDLANENWDGYKFLGGQPKFSDQGRAILDYNEALWLLEKKQAELHRPFVIHLEFDQISIVKLLQLVRKFVIHLSPEPDFISSRTTAEEAKSMLKYMAKIHGFDVGSVDNGVLVLTNMVSFNFAYLFQDSVEYQKGLNRALKVMKAAPSSVFFVDCNIIKDFYVNKKVMQRETSLLEELDYTYDDSEEDNINELDILNITAAKVMDTASKIMIARTTNENEKLGKILFNKSEEMQERVQRVAEQAMETKKETNLEIQSLKNRITLYQENVKMTEDENNEITKQHIEKEGRMGEKVSKLEKLLGKMEAENNEKTDQISALAEELVDLRVSQLSNVSKSPKKVSFEKAIKTEPNQFYNYSSSSDEYDEIDEAFTSPPNVKSKSLWKPTISTLTEDNKTPKPGVPTLEQSGVGSKKEVFIGTPSKFGMKSWDETNSSLLEHLLSIEMGLAQAEARGCTLKTRQNLILMTLPRNYEYVIDFIEETDRSSMDSFKKRLITLIDGTNTDQTSHFLQAQRKSDENILTYFRRLKALYLSCTKTSESDLETDTMGTNMMFQKIQETLPQMAKIEFTRLCENALNEGTFSLTKLKMNTVVASRKIPKTPQVLINPVQNTGSLRGISPDARNEPNGFRERSKPYTRETRTCYYCNRPGHLARNCFRRKPSIDMQNRHEREPKSPYGIPKPLFRRSYGQLGPYDNNINGQFGDGRNNDARHNPDNYGRKRTYVEAVQPNQRYNANRIDK